MMKATNLSLQYGKRKVLKGVDLSVQAGEFIGLIGPNGAGKSSLMRAMMGFVPEAQGNCDFWSYSKIERARNAAWLSQERELNWDLRVEEVVELARLPWQGMGALDAKDVDAVDRALKRLNLQDDRKRRLSMLSGGERARVFLARLLAQDTPVIFADEPIAALDPGHQIHAMKLLAQMASEGRAVLISIHELGMAARFCTRLCLMDEGRIVSDDRPELVLSDENLSRVFGVEVFRAQAGGMVLQPIELVER